MKRNILFIHGGGGVKDYRTDAKLVASLKKILGEAYAVHYPLLQNEKEPDFGRKKQISKEILVGHSLGVQCC
jgi:uncharacterized protein